MIGPGGVPPQLVNRAQPAGQPDPKREAIEMREPTADSCEPRGAPGGWRRLLAWLGRVVGR